MNRVELQAAYILHQRPYRNTSVILDAITLHHGRVGIVARGARGGKRNIASQLQPFRQLLLSWTGRGELFNLTGAEEASFKSPPASLHGEALYCGYYINELTLKLLPRDDPHEEVFAVYNQTINGLYNDNATIEAVLRGYELALLESLGYQLVLHNEVGSGDLISEQESYRYIVERGPVYAHRAETAGVSVSGCTLLGLAKRDFSLPATLVESRRLLRMLIDHQLDGRPLKTREMFRSLFRASAVVNASEK
jgi:DNA repair protein RecO (recombination protein O)